MRIISQKQALNLMLALLSTVMAFHILVISEIIPYNNIWAGKLNTIEEMRRFETVSISINTFFITVLLLRGDFIKNRIPIKLLNCILWLFVVIFTLNTVGNLFAKTKLELYVFTPLTFVSALLCLRILIPGKSHSH